MDHRGEAVARALFAAEADEADVLRRIGELVRADRRVGDDRARRADTAAPFITALVGGLQACGGRGRAPEVQQEARRALVGVMEYEVALRRDRFRKQWSAAL